MGIGSLSGTIALAACASLLGVEPLAGETEGGADAGDNAPEASVSPDASSDALLADETSPSSGCSYAWVVADGGDVPANAIPNRSADAGIVIYVCRATEGTDVIPGKLLPGWGCYAVTSAMTGPYARYEVLVQTQCDVGWPYAYNGILPPDSLPSGHDSQGSLYACRVDQGPDVGELGHVGLSTNHLCSYTLSDMRLTTGTLDILTIH